MTQPVARDNVLRFCGVGQQNYAANRLTPGGAIVYRVGKVQFPAPVVLHRITGTLSWAPNDPANRSAIRDALVWMRVPGHPPLDAPVLSPPADGLGMFNQGVSDGFWQANVKSFGESGVLPVHADFGPGGVLAPAGLIEVVWDSAGYSPTFPVGVRSSDGKLALNLELSVVFAYTLAPR